MNNIELMMSCFVVGLMGSGHCIGMCGGIANSLGFALSQGYLSETYLTRKEINRLLTIRYLDDWGYQSIVRNQVNQDVIWPKKINGTDLSESQAYVEAYVGLEMKDFISEYLKEYLPNDIRFKKVEMPWSRMFEVLPILEN